MVISRKQYQNQLEGFWLGESIANHTGLITELDKDGTTTEKSDFYTDANWGLPDPVVGSWVTGKPPIVDFVLNRTNNIWRSDDDTDLEYIYLHLLSTLKTSILTPEQIRDGWIAYIWDETKETPYGLDWDGTYQNWLWVSNQSAHTLMLEQNMVPPDTSDPVNNKNYLMIDAQLTTEIFGVFAPARWDVALDMAYLPIRTTARDEAAWISEFYVIMHSLASVVDPELTMEEKVMWLAKQARKRLPEDSFASGMYDYVLSEFEKNPDNWEDARDQVYTHYQDSSNDGYRFLNASDAGINFAASLVSLFYGRGHLPRTIQIGSLAGWDSDNPTATWGGLLGFLLGADGVKCAFAAPDLEYGYLISATRKDLPDHTPDSPGEDNFTLMASRGLEITDRAIVEEMGGTIDTENNSWIIPVKDLNIPYGTKIDK
ncbi:MAG: ADP-ribosylglycohydrolase family protein [Deltaproteobacteria bacterium]|nr:ADP-ribosylglycohydrolase family protein [Deltaproteobacteria bacterium]